MFRTTKGLKQNIDYFPESEEELQQCITRFGRLTQFSQSLNSVVEHISGCCQVCRDILKYCPVCQQEFTCRLDNAQKLAKTAFICQGCYQYVHNKCKGATLNGAKYCKKCAVNKFICI